LHEIIFEEAAELLAEMESAFLTLETTPDDEEILNTIFRCVHSIKGAASMFGFTELSQFAHDFENVLDRVRHHQIAVSRPVIDLLLRASDMLKSLLAQSKGEGTVETTTRATIVAELQSLMQPQETTSAPIQPAKSLQHSPPLPPGHCYEIIFKPSRDSFHKGVDPAEILTRLPRLGDVIDVQVDISSLPPLDSLNPEECYLGWTIQLRTSEDVKMVQAMFEDAHAGSVLHITESAKVSSSIPIVSDEDQVPLLGALLLQEGVPAQDLAAALSKQKKLGELLLEEGALSRQQLDHVLEKQQQLRQKQ
jgi:two-component system chemotaxis sensor kinase CheA